MDDRAALARLIADARRIVVFTGAGISTESGVPDFRSPGGVWNRMKPIYFQEFVASEDKRREAWTRTFKGSAGWTGAKPNAGHYAVARLVGEGKVGAVITQNVDNLHQDSGVSPEKIIEVHGNASYAKCLECGLRHEFAELKPAFLQRDEIPACRICGGIVKSATISFGQAMPERKMRQAAAWSTDCDLFLAIGTSLVVYPAAGLPVAARDSGAHLVIINREETPLDHAAHLVIRADIGEVLQGLARRLGIEHLS